MAHVLFTPDHGSPVVCENAFIKRVVEAVYHSDEWGCWAEAYKAAAILNADARRNRRDEWGVLIFDAPDLSKSAEQSR